MKGLRITAVALGTVTLLAAAIGAQQVQPVVGPPIKDRGNAEVVTIGLGSCLRESRPAPILKTVADAKPDLFVFLGDNIYGDTTDAAVFTRKYRKLLGAPGFTDLRQNTTVLAIWDDHDYGKNDAGDDYTAKALSKDLFLKFWGEPAGSPRWSAAGNYGSEIYGPEGRRVQMILLDTRWFRSPLTRLEKPGDYGPYAATTDTKTTILGEQQWQWLEEELKKPAELRVICSSIQVLADEHNFEKWGSFPHERKRLLDLLERTSGAIILTSGDRHAGELSRMELASGRRVYDVTSSALNQGNGQTKVEPNALRRGPLVTEPHFGWIEIDWDEKTVRFQLRRESGSVIQETNERMDRMGPQSGTAPRQ